MSGLGILPELRALKTDLLKIQTARAGGTLLAGLAGMCGQAKVWRHKPGRQWWVRLASHQPGGAVVGVAVPLVVHGDDVHQDYVLGLRIHAGKRHTDSRKHPPDTGRQRGPA